ncbi:MAG: cytochrome d ubiquinol oxidase subunit II, partial [Gemmatimonadota bacterium]|nr:cytochrome d ubiquinol oxidase subunit II [Gemmatimonadota bacterium]
MEFRGAVDSHGWRKVWDWSFGLGSLVPALLYGVAIGNILRGLPIQADGTLYISLLYLLNPYALLVGLLSLVMFTMHGAAYLALKTEGDRQKELARWIIGSWMAFVVLYLVATVATYFVSGFLFEGILASPLFWILLPLLLIAIIAIPVATKAGKFRQAFQASSVTIMSMIGLMGLSLFPRMVPSIIDLNNSLTIYNASSTGRTLYVMLVIALIGMPVVIGYTIFIYRVFKGKVVLTDESY